jgi:hypothetical protein
MRTLFLAAAPILALAVATPALSQGSTQTPPSPNAAVSGPTSPNSVPPGARTLPPGTTGVGREGTVSRTHYGRRHRHHHRNRARVTEPDVPAAQTVPVPQSR